MISKKRKYATIQLVQFENFESTVPLNNIIQNKQVKKLINLNFTVKHCIRHAHWKCHLLKSCYSLKLTGCFANCETPLGQHEEMKMSNPLKLSSSHRDSNDVTSS